MSKAGRTVRLPLVLEPQPEGGYTVTSPAIKGLITEGDSIEEALEHAKEAFAVAVEFYEDNNKPLPKELFVKESDAAITAEILVRVTTDELIPT